MTERERMWELAAALRGVSEMVERRVAASDEDPVAVRVLALLAGGDGARPAQVTRELGLSPAATTRRLRGLQEAGQIGITPDPEDGRSYTAHITSSGRARLARFADRTADSMAAALTGWTAQDIQALTALLSRLLDAEARATAASPAPPTTPPPDVGRSKWWHQIESAPTQD